MPRTTKKAGREEGDASDARAVRAAGGLVWRLHRGKPQVLVVHRPAYDDWSLPKGKLEDGEGEADAAVREVKEETSLDCRLGADLGHVAYRDASGRPKTVRYWQMHAAEGEADPAHEIDDLRWLGFGKARRLLSYESERAMLDRFRPPPGPDEKTTVWLVRHARAGDRLDWTGDDRTRPLVRSGWAQADAIARMLRRRPLAGLVASPWTRCTQTLEPLARRRDLAIRTSALLGEGTDAAEALDFLAGEALGGPLAASTHGDVMMQGVELLLSQGTRLRGEAGDYAKGCTWELVRKGGRWKSARHHAAP